MVSFTPRQWRKPPASAIQAPPTSIAGQRHADLRRQRRACAPCAVSDHGCGQAAEHERAFAADDDEASLRRQRHAQRRQDQRRGALQRVLPREAAAESAFVDERVDFERILADAPR